MAVWGTCGRIAVICCTMESIPGGTCGNSDSGMMAALGLCCDVSEGEGFLLAKRAEKSAQEFFWVSNFTTYNSNLQAYKPQSSAMN